MPVSLQTVTESIATVVGAVVLAGGGIGAIGFGMFKFFGEKWLNTKFEERLAALRHAQQKELEELIPGRGIPDSRGLPESSER